MADLNFPVNPVLNQTYVANNVIYTWNGDYWEANSQRGYDDTFVEVAGDTMTGQLTLPGGGGATQALQKQEIETLVAAGGGGGGGGGTVVNYNGASAWASFNGTVPGVAPISASQNIASITRTGVGLYAVVFTIPLASDNYAVVSNTYSYTGNQTANGFSIQYISPDSGAVADVNPGAFAVHSENAIAPQSGVGADAWANVAADGTLEKSFNITSVTKTSTGTYSLAFTSPMPTDKYSLVTSPTLASRWVRTISTSTTGAVLEIQDGSGAAADTAFSFTVHSSSTVTPTYTWTRDGTTLKPANDGDNVTVGSAGGSGSGRPAGVSINSGNFIYASRANGPLWTGYIVGTNDETSTINADGSASFSGRVGINTPSSSEARLNVAGTVGGGGLTIGTDPTNLVDTTTAKINNDGSAEFTNGVNAARNTTGGGEGTVTAQQRSSSGYCFEAKNNAGAVTWNVKVDGSSTFAGNVTASNVTFNLEPDNVANFSAEGEYNGPTLDVKALLLTLQTAATRIATLEAKVQTLEADHATAMNNMNNGGY